jgi:hypothetical protein
MNTSKPPLRQALHVVALVQHQLQLSHRRGLGDRIDQRIDLTRQMQPLVSLAQQLQQAWRCRYNGACRILERRFDRRLTELLAEVHFLRASQVLDTAEPTPVPGHRQLLDELRQIEDEFGSWSLEDDGPSLAVDTDPITLEGVALGPFSIVLEIEHLNDPSPRIPLRVKALNPNPAAESSRVTHPHVSDERVCLGDAATAVHAALRAGRLADVFLLVRNVLQTYNADSPYVALESWEYESCPECGGPRDADNNWYCETCGRDFCDSCVGSCHDCDASTCHGCLRTCDHCDNTFCPDCLANCAACGERCCRDCLSDDLCPTCFQEKESEDDHDELTRDDNHCATEHEDAAGQTTITQPAAA